MSSPSLTSLPPEILEKIFHHVSSDISTCRSLSATCTTLHAVIVRVPVLVTIPVQDDDLRWLRENNVPIRYLYNCEIAAYVSDQIFALNLSQLRVAKLVGYDYQSRKCEVTQAYLLIVERIRRKARHCLRRLELNVDISRGRRSFRFAELLPQFVKLKSLSIHFSASIELNQRILNNDDSQIMIDTILSNLPNLRIFNIYINPQRKLQIKSRQLKELGIYKSDSIITKLDLPCLLKLNLHENTVTLFRKIINDREVGGKHLHRDLLAIIYDGCPSLQSINHLRLSPQLCSKYRPDKETWTRHVNSLLVQQYKQLLTQTQHSEI